MTNPAPPDSCADPAAAPLLLDAAQAARLCGLSRSGWWGLLASGRIPEGLKLGRRRLWRRAELADWCEAGCPPRARWTWKGATR